jgi:hypothetical protein
MKDKIINDLTSYALFFALPFLFLAVVIYIGIYGGGYRQIEDK